MKVTSGDVVLFRGSLEEVISFLDTLVGQELPGPDLTVTSL